MSCNCIYFFSALDGKDQKAFSNYKKSSLPAEVDFSKIPAVNLRGVFQNKWVIFCLTIFLFDMGQGSSYKSQFANRNVVFFKEKGKIANPNFFIKLLYNPIIVVAKNNHEQGFNAK